MTDERYRLGHHRMTNERSSPLRRAVETFADLCGRLRRAERLLEMVPRLVTSFDAISKTVATLAQKPSEPTYIYLLPPETEDRSAPRPPMHCRRVVLDAGSTGHIETFHQYYDHGPPGYWVVIVGPATVLDVRLGNESQVMVSSHTGGGHVLRTRRSWEVGVHLSVVLRAPTAPTEPFGSPRRL